MLEIERGFDSGDDLLEGVARPPGVPLYAHVHLSVDVPIVRVLAVQVRVVAISVRGVRGRLKESVNTER